MNRFKQNLTKDRVMFAIRIITGIIISILVASALKVDFAPSTGVITLLTIDQTKKDTFRRIGMRIVTFIYTYLISWMTVDLFHLETTIGFSVAITLVVFITFFFNFDLTLSVNCVILIQLFLNSKPFTLNLFINESMRLTIGLLSAILVNWIYRAKYDSDDKPINIGNNP